MAATDDDRGYVKAWRARLDAARSRDEVWRTTAVSHARRIATLLCTDFGATTVVLFGSVARGDAATVRSDGSTSDIDLLVTGVAAKDWWDAVAAVRPLDDGALRVDLVRAEEASDALIAVATREGVVVSDAR